MLFVACSVSFHIPVPRDHPEEPAVYSNDTWLILFKYISLAEARKWGAESILAIRNLFYRRAKVRFTQYLHPLPPFPRQELTRR